MSCFGVVGNGEGHIRGTRLGADLPERFVAVRVEPSAFTGCDGRVFDPELEAAVGAD